MNPRLVSAEPVDYLLTPMKTLFGFRSLILSSLLLSSPFLFGADDKSTAPKAWGDWAAWVEGQKPVTDKDGHGPDIGSDEWASALGKRLKISDAAGHGPDVKSEEWRAAVEKKLAPPAAPKEERQLLSSHDTVATFEGLSDHRCRGATGLCPDRCGSSGKLATFKITKYLGYEKPGEYGDPKQDKFMLLIEDNLKNAKVAEPILKAITALKPGDSVRLKWNHDYVTRGGSKSPERPIVSLTTLTPEEAEKAAADKTPPPKK